MTTDSIRKQVDQIVAEEFELDPARISPASDLYDDLGLDSLDAIDLVVALEKSFGFKVEEGAARKIRRLEQLYQFVAERVA
ncbi:MAG: acyl carrier protein [Planctomycetes bacterium]|nr:acyl carrier protein [Planctomycetota bacterium]MCB9934193.1 acyl carrier protein [Planctomycetota bacterium]